MPVRATVVPGQVFGKLTVLSDAGRNKHSNTIVLVQCECGAKKVMLYCPIFRGKHKTCGCSRFKHGHAPLGKPTREYRTYLQMIGRCYNPKNKNYHRYGGRGIWVCNEWKDSFLRFLKDMGPKPKGMTLDRINNDGEYSKKNCRWATPRTQCNNRRSNRYIKFRGKTKTLMEWARKFDLATNTLRFRIVKGWATHDAFTRPVGITSSPARRKPHTQNGHTKTH